MTPWPTRFRWGRLDIMSNAERLLAQALNLSVEERRHLARELVLSLEGHDEDGEAAWGVEVERRVQEILDGRVEMIDGDEAHRMLRARLQTRHA